MCIIAFNYLWLYINTQEVYSYSFITLHADSSAGSPLRNAKGRVFRPRYLNHGYLLILLSQPRPRREPRHSASFENIKRSSMVFSWEHFVADFNPDFVCTFHNNNNNGN